MDCDDNWAHGQVDGSDSGFYVSAEKNADQAPGIL